MEYSPQKLAAACDLIDIDVLNKVLKSPPNVVISTLSFLRFPTVITTLRNHGASTRIPLNLCLRVQGAEQMNLAHKHKILDTVHQNFSNYDIQFTQGNYGTGSPRYDVVNRALTHFNADYICTYDDDILIPPLAVEAQIAVLEKHPQFGAIGVWLSPRATVWENIDGKIQHRRATNSPFEHTIALGWASMCIRKEVFKTCHVDPNYYLGWGDMDFGTQLTANNWKLGMLTLPNFKMVNAGPSPMDYIKIRKAPIPIKKSVEYFNNKWDVQLVTW